MQPPALAMPYRWPEMRRLCQRITNTARNMQVSDHRIDIIDVRPYQVQPGWKIGVHAHSFYEAHVFLQGTGTYQLAGNKCIEPGSIVFHGPHTLHAWEADQHNVRLVIWFRLTPDIPIPVPKHWPVRPTVVSDISLLLDEASRVTPGWRERVQLRLQILLSMILNGISEDETTTVAVEHIDTLVETVDRFLRDNLAGSLTVTDVAAHLGMSTSSLAHQFTRETGESIMRRLGKLRMDHAAELLLETTDALSAIATRVGMPDTSYFCRRFRQHFNVTPNTYRTQTVKIDK